VINIFVFSAFRPNSLLASDNPASPAEAGRLDSRLKFFFFEETKQFKPAKRGTKNSGLQHLQKYLFERYCYNRFVKS